VAISIEHHAAAENKQAAKRKAVLRGAEATWQSRASVTPQQKINRQRSEKPYCEEHGDVAISSQAFTS